jgi:hypothetical protein
VAHLQAANGNPPYRWSHDLSTPLPPGLRLTANGVIIGRPKTAGTYSFTVEVKDRATKAHPGTASMATLSITVTN